jgi:hypothetical protein
MALDADDLAQAMVDAIKDEFKIDERLALKMCKKLATAIVEHIAANAEVEVTGVSAGGDTATGTVS